jgi:hypothetical protein
VTTESNMTLSYVVLRNQILKKILIEVISRILITKGKQNSLW